MRPLLNAGHDPAEYVAIARALGVDPYELLAQAENEVDGRHRRIDLTLCSHPVDGRSRRIALKNSLIAAFGADSLLLGGGDSADDGRAAGDAGGAVLRLQP